MRTEGKADETQRRRPIQSVKIPIEIGVGMNIMQRRKRSTAAVFQWPAKRRPNEPVHSISMRICEICGGADLAPLHRQHFLFPGLAQPIHYDVVACRNCGFTFANNIPDQSSLNQFYQAAEHHLHTALPPGLKRIHGDFFQFIQNHAALSPEMDILDIGSGMGHFLQHFKAAGFSSLLGIEPSPAAAHLAREIYDLEIKTATIDNLALDKKFDLVTLCGVLEHIADLRQSIARIASFLHDEGYLFIAVPDAAAFGIAPPAEAFLEFALEHINFFSDISLDNLLQQAGFTRIAIASQHNDFYHNDYLLALYQKIKFKTTEVLFDSKSSHSISAYIDLSKQQLKPLAERIERLVATQAPVIIWGAGALTSRLLCDTRLGEANIHSIVDKNRNLHGKNLNGICIRAPESIRAHCDHTVFIASTTYAEEITQILKTQYAWTGDIITARTDSL